MKLSIVILIATIGVVMVAADENLESRLRTALKSMLQDKLQNEEKEELEMEARDSLARCEKDTSRCDGHGSCQQSTFGRSYGQFICFCDSGYIGNSYGGCSESRLRTALKSMLQDKLQNEEKEDLEMEARDSVARCEKDTSRCNGHGSCQQSTFGRSYGQYICFCDSGYIGNSYGGCSVETTREFELKDDEEMDKKKAYAQDADEEERTMELMRRLAELYQE